MKGCKLFLIIVFCFGSMIPRLYAANLGIAEFDRVWEKRQAEAQKNTVAAYTHNPEDVTADLNYQVNKEYEDNNKKDTTSTHKGRINHANTNNTTNTNTNDSTNTNSSSTTNDEAELDNPNTNSTNGEHKHSRGRKMF